MELTSKEAFQLSKGLRNVSIAIGDYRFQQWDGLSESQRRTLEDAEWSLLNASSDVLTAAVGLVLDETQWGCDALKKLTDSAKETLKQLAAMRKAIRIATAAVSLAAAIVSKDLGAIAKNAAVLNDILNKNQA